jgi:hypothetical protein
MNLSTEFKSDLYRLLDHVREAEAKSFEDYIREGGDPKHHIFATVQRLDKVLEDSSDGIELPGPARDAISEYETRIYYDNYLYKISGGFVTHRVIEDLGDYWQIEFCYGIEEEDGSNLNYHKLFLVKDNLEFVENEDDLYKE